MFSLITAIFSCTAWPTVWPRGVRLLEQRRQVGRGVLPDVLGDLP